MYTVKQASKALGISNTTLRQRGAEYAEFLSDQASPPKGQTRKYTDEDIDVLWTVAALKTQNKTDEEIAAALERGERSKPVEPPGQQEKKEKTTIPGDDKALVTSEFAAALQSYETQLTKLQQKNDELHERLLDAEKRATIAETKLEVVSILGDDETTAGGDVQSGGGDDRQLTMRQRLAKWIAGES